MTDLDPKTCMADGCDEPMIVTDWMYPTVQLTAAGGKLNDESAPRRQIARCKGEVQHQFERYEGFDWKPAGDGGSA